ncbi:MULTISPECIES: hypothetical protein [Bacillus]|uniref:hypothetical protein n=1 Tax=Bacillus TaxID=1386 RepID=UPI000C771065|nr:MULTISPECIES: hypothetical protein [Bacillus]MCP1159374.1 hypothetical protein [Bacillus infantis]PLR72259.1 hypothetical protein CYJ37_11935 [Bacillus sp. UMB0728]
MKLYKVTLEENLYITETIVMAADPEKAIYLARKLIGDSTGKTILYDIQTYYGGLVVSRNLR